MATYYIDSEFSRQLSQLMIQKINAFQQLSTTKTESITSSSSSTSTTNESSDDSTGFPSIGTWEAHAIENNVRVSKKRRRVRRIRRLWDSDEEEEEEDVGNNKNTPEEPPIQQVPNPFCARDSSGAPQNKTKRVCFNPNVNYHYYEPN